MVSDFKNLGPTTKKRQEETVYLKGTFKWMRHLEPDFAYEPAGKWSTVIVLAGEELDKFREWQGMGIRNTLKKDEEGWYATLSRKCSYLAKGKHIGRDAPEVFQLGDDGVTHIPILTRVGNGSSGIAKCVLWSTPNYPGKNLRWEAARVDHLVEWNPQNDFPDGGAEFEELKAQPKELF